MRNAGDILLISCYELGHQPYHLASLLAMLQQADYNPVAVDTAVETLTDEAIQKAQFIAISVPMHTALRLGEQIAHRVRSVNSKAHICLYGLYALLNADYLLQEKIDSAIGGEYEVPLLRLVDALERKESMNVPGVHTRTNQSGPWIQRTPFVLPQRQMLPPLEQYARLQIGNEVFVSGYTEATRGCKHTCLHCPVTPIYGGRFFAIPVNHVMSDIRAQILQGARHITFGDPDFWNGPTHALRIVRMLHEEFPDVTFDATIKVEHLLKHSQLLTDMKENGCAFIVSAVESINDDVLVHLDKGHTSQDVADMFTLTQKAGIPVRPSLLPFSPWETLDSYIALLDFFEQRHLIEHLDLVHFSIRLLIPPGSALLEASKTSEWLGDLDADNYTYRWRHPDPRMDTLQHDVATLVEQAESVQADTVETFFRAKALALAMAGNQFSVEQAIQAYGTPQVLPHLTESWFC
ncbi:MAG TPA: radical SAM protein [Ktedonobacter sp.]|nr:radical SAM protein [Ktedonobacter sp.]